MPGAMWLLESDLFEGSLSPTAYAHASAELTEEQAGSSGCAQGNSIFLVALPPNVCPTRLLPPWYAQQC